MDNQTAQESLLQAGLSSKPPGIDRRGGKQPKHLSSGDSCPQWFSPRRLWADISRSGRLPLSPWSDLNEKAPSPPSGLAVLHLITLAGILYPEHRAESLAVCSGDTLHTATSKEPVSFSFQTLNPSLPLTLLPGAISSLGRIEILTPYHHQHRPPSKCLARLKSWRG